MTGLLLKRKVIECPMWNVRIHKEAEREENDMECGRQEDRRNSNASNVSMPRTRLKTVALETSI